MPDIRLFALSVTCLALAPADLAHSAEPATPRDKLPRIAAVVTVYYKNSHADVIASRLLEGFDLDGKGERPKLKLVSLHTDQVPENDISRELMKRHGVPIYDTVAGALTLGGEKLAVDGVLLIAEHGKYPESETGQFVFPKRRLFGEIAKVFEQSGRAVPVFSDKHLADNWEDAKWLYDTSRRLKAPLMAGSSLPVAWRKPALDTVREAPLKEIVVLSYHRLDSYGFHALEAAQCLAERRRGGETGVAGVRCLEGNAVWEGGKSGLYDPALLAAALARLEAKPLPKDKRLEDLVKDPVLFVIDYKDGTKARVFTLNGAVQEWTAAWRYAKDERVESTLFWVEDEHPFRHFSLLVQGIEQMLHSGEPSWPAERTLLTSGLLDALLVSKKNGGRVMETPQLEFSYNVPWNWREPPPLKSGRNRN